MMVWAIFGIRNEEKYEDPGARELIALYETKAAATTAAAAELAACFANPFSNTEARKSDGYDGIEIGPVEVQT